MDSLIDLEFDLWMQDQIERMRLEWLEQEYAYYTMRYYTSNSTEDENDYEKWK